jgi:hypothetical protein
MRLSFFRPNGKNAYERFDERHVQRAHENDDLASALDKAGFELLGVYDAFTTEPPKPESERIQFVARKRESGTGDFIGNRK